MEAQILRLDVRKFHSIVDFTVNFKEKNLIFGGSEEDQNALYKAFQFVFGHISNDSNSDDVSVTIKTTENLLTFNRQMQGNNVDILEIGINGEMKPVSASKYNGELEKLCFTWKPNFIDVSKAFMFATHNNINQFLCNEFNISSEEIQRMKTAQETSLFEKSVLRKKLKHLEANQIEFNAIEALKDQPTNTQLPPYSVPNDFTTAKKVLAEKVEDPFNMEEFEANFDNFLEQINSNAENMEEEKEDDQSEAEKSASEQETVDNENIGKANQFVDDFISNMKNKPIVYQLKFQKFKFWLFDDIKEKLFANLGPHREYMRTCVAFNQLAHNTLYVTSDKEANAIARYMKSVNTQETFRIKILPTKNNEIDTLPLAKRYLFAETPEIGKKILQKNPRAIVISKSGIAMHPNGLIQCGWTNVFDIKTTKEEWNLEDCLKATENRIDVKALKLNLQNQTEKKLCDKLKENELQRLNLIEKRHEIASQNKIISSNIADRSDEMEEHKQQLKVVKRKLRANLMDTEDRNHFEKLTKISTEFCQHLIDDVNLKLIFDCENEKSPFLNEIVVNHYFENRIEAEPNDLIYIKMFGLLLALNEVLRLTVIITNGLDNILPENIIGRFVSFDHFDNNNKQIINIFAGIGAPAEQFQENFNQIIEIYRNEEGLLQTAESNEA